MPDKAHRNDANSSLDLLELTAWILCNHFKHAASQFAPFAKICTIQGSKHTFNTNRSDLNSTLQVQLEGSFILSAAAFPALTRCHHLCSQSMTASFTAA
eukprot:4282803-Pleurochrysis_carterae.AAC.2